MCNGCIKELSADILNFIIGDEEQFLSNPDANVSITVAALYSAARQLEMLSHMPVEVGVHLQAQGRCAGEEEVHNLRLPHVKRDVGKSQVDNLVMLSQARETLDFN